jgi:hypothetical protein
MIVLYFQNRKCYLLQEHALRIPKIISQACKVHAASKLGATSYVLFMKPAVVADGNENKV